MECRREEFARRLRALRGKRKVTRSILAQLCGLHTNAVSEYERGVTMPSVESLAKLAEYFDVTMDYLVGRDDDVAKRGGGRY